MPANYDSVDLSFTWNGDYEFDGGDLADTSDDHIQAFQQDLATIVASSEQDWENYPYRAAGVDDWVGEPNTRRTAIALKERVNIALVSSGVVADGDLTVKVVPVHIHRVLIVLGIKALATQFNSLEVGSRLTVALLFDSMEHQVSFLDKPLLGAQ
tara:strand:+ start:12771 stop:13235 length:465 start_codon:yes stop_codon:yes gene_type:complete